MPALPWRLAPCCTHGRASVSVRDDEISQVEFDPGTHFAPTERAHCQVRTTDFDSRRRAAYIQCRYMATVTQIAKWGNSLGLRLPKSVALEAQVGEGDTVDVSVKNGAIVVRPNRPSYSLKQLVAKITPRNRHNESDWGTPVGDEVW